MSFEKKFVTGEVLQQVVQGVRDKIKGEIVDNLESTDVNKPLSANQGKVLNDTKLDKTGGAVKGNLNVTGSLQQAGNNVWHAGNFNPSEYSPTSHTHDDRYYTESEIDSKLNTKLDKDGKHEQASDTITSMTGYEKAGTGEVLSTDNLNQAIGKLEVKADKALDIANSAVPKDNIVNDLTTGGTNKVLSAEQGKVLKSLLDSVSGDSSGGLVKDSKSYSKILHTGDLTANGKDITVGKKLYFPALFLDGIRIDESEFDVNHAGGVITLKQPYANYQVTWVIVDMLPNHIKFAYPTLNMLKADEGIKKLINLGDVIEILGESDADDGGHRLVKCEDSSKLNGVQIGEGKYLNEIPNTNIVRIKDLAQKGIGTIGRVDGEFPLESATLGGVYYYMAGNKYYKCVKEYSGQSISNPNSHFDELSVYENRDRLDNLGKELPNRIDEYNSNAVQKISEFDTHVNDKLAACSTDLENKTSTEVNKVVEQVKTIVAENPATTNALTLSGKTRVEFENEIKHESSIVKEDVNKIHIEGYSKEMYKDILHESNYTKGMYVEILDGQLKKTSNTAYNLHMFDISRYETFKVKGVYFFDIYPMIFTDNNDKVILHYPVDRNTKLDVITVECSKPVGATRLYVTEREVDKSTIFARQISFFQGKELKEKLKYSEFIKDLEIEDYSRSDFKSILSDKYLIEGAYVESTTDDKKYKITKNAAYKYYKVPVTPGKTIKTFGIYGFDIKAVIFLDSQDKFVSSSDENRVTQITEKETKIKVPANAEYAIINGKATTEIKCSEDGHLTFLTKNKESKSVKLIKVGDKVTVESLIGKDTMSIVSYLHGSQNQSFRFDKYYLNGIQWKVADDDITPLNFNGSYRGAGHGDDRGYTINFSSPHNLTEINIGEIWTDKNNVEVLICKIINETSILTCIPNNTAKSNESPFNVAVLASPLKKDTITKEFTTVKRGQFAPIQNFVDVKVICNNKQIIEDGEYTADYIDVVESYNLLYLPSMVEYLKNNVGRNTNDSMYSNNITDKYCTVNNVFRFTERGAITQYQSIDWYKTVKLNFVGMIQSQPIGSFISVPLTNKSSLQEMSTDTIRFEQSSWNDINIPPNRYYQYTDSSMKKGICLGYNTEFGDGKSEIRKNINDAGFIYGSSKKLYPYLVSKENGQDYSKFISAISYRVPMTTYNNNIPSVGWYYVNDDIYLLINIQESTNVYINLPEKMLGRKVYIVEKEGNIDIYDEFVGAKGIKVVCTGYASAIIKLSM